MYISWVVTVLLLTKLGARAGLGASSLELLGDRKECPGMLSLQKSMACNFLGFFGIAKVARKTK